MNTLSNKFQYTLLAVTVVFVALALAIAPINAKAADLPIDGGGYWYTESATPYFDSLPMDTSGYWYTESATPYYDYAPSYYDSFSYPSYSAPYSFFTPSYYSAFPSQSQSQSQSLSNTNVNTNTCTNNSCNTNLNAPTTINAPTTVTVASTPAPSYPVYPVYPTYPTYPTVYDICPNIAGTQSTLPAGYYIQNGYCYVTYSYPTAQPYVTLSQVPYTGLELGPVGTALYWTFIVLWALFAAYLIVVKRVQNKIANYFFGRSRVAHAGNTASHTHTKHAAPEAAPAHEDSIDPFIQSQIYR